MIIFSQKISQLEIILNFFYKVQMITWHAAEMLPAPNITLEFSGYLLMKWYYPQSQISDNLISQNRFRKADQDFLK